jgi:hypothetical protein
MSAREIKSQAYLLSWHFSDVLSYCNSDEKSIKRHDTMS